jgi:imidazolonepropionase-like amidohydrolase
MNAVVFNNATILDVVRGRLIPNQRVLVQGSRIADIGDRVDTPPQARVIDVAGRVLMPGLCDAHVHVTAFTADFQLLERTSPTYVAAQANHILKSMLLRGFTTVRDAGGADHGLARALREKLLVGPRLLYCEKALSQTGGHGDMRHPGEHQSPECQCCSGLGRICDGVSEVRRACRDTIRQGATHIKLMVSGGVSSPTDRISSTQFSTDELAAAVEEANAAQIYCMAHAYTSYAIQRAVRAGCRSIEHGNLLDRETAELMSAKGTFLVPTLVTYDALAREGAQGGLSSAMQEKLRDVLESGLRALQIAVDAKVRLVFGTDLLGLMHRRQLDEFALRAQIQKPIDVIRSATVHAAELFNMEGQIGVLAPGASADLLMIDGDPTDDIRVLQNLDQHLHAVMLAGDLVHSKA